MPIGGFIRRPGQRMGPPNESRERQGNIGISIRRPPTADHDRRMDLTRTGHIRRFHSAVSEPPIKPPFQPERLKSVRYERRFRSAVGNRRSKPKKKLQKPLVIFGGFIPWPGRRTRPPFHQNW